MPINRRLALVAVAFCSRRQTQRLGYSSDYDDRYEDREALTRYRQALGISIKYVETWKSRDAFQEFF